MGLLHTARTGDYIDKPEHVETGIHLFILCVIVHRTTGLHLLKVLLKPSPKQVAD